MHRLNGLFLLYFRGCCLLTSHTILILTDPIAHFETWIGHYDAKTACQYHRPQVLIPDLECKINQTCAHNDEYQNYLYNKQNCVWLRKGVHGLCRR